MKLTFRPFHNNNSVPGNKNLVFWIIVGLSIATLSATTNIRSFSCSDSATNILIPISILREGNVELSEFKDFAQGKFGQDYWAAGTPNGLFSKYSIWTGVMITPLLLPVAYFNGFLMNPDVIMKISWLLAVLFCAATATLLSRTLALWVSTRWAIFMTFLAFFGTGIWHHATSQLSNQTLPLFCITALLFALSQKTITGRRAFIVGLLAGLASASRPAAICTAVFPLGIIISRKDLRPQLRWAMLGFLIFPCLTLVYNAMVFEHPFKTGYAYFSYDSFNENMFLGLTGLLVSPSAGLLAYSPFLVFGIWEGISCFFRKENTDINLFARWIFLGFLGQWVVFSRWHAWNGGTAYGSRMMIETIPLLMVLTACRWKSVVQKNETKVLFILLGILSVFIYFLGTVTFDSIVSKPALGYVRQNWSLRTDVLLLYMEHFGWVPLLKEVARKGLSFIAMTVILFMLLRLVPRQD